MSTKGTQLDRRRFLKVSGIAGVAVGAVAVSQGNAVLDAFGNLFRQPRYTSADLDAELLGPMAGETVAALSNGNQVSLVVDEVTTGSQILSDDGTSVGSVFSVMLTGPAATPLTQGTYEIESDRVGTFPLFVVPTDANEVGGQRYEAVFSRLR